MKYLRNFRSDKRLGNRGFSLPIVLATIGLIAGLLLSYMSTSRSELGSTQNYTMGTKAAYCAEIAVKAALNDNSFIDALGVLAVDDMTSDYPLAGPVQTGGCSYKYKGKRLADDGRQKVYCVYGIGTATGATRTLAAVINGLSLLRMGDFAAASIGNLNIKNTGAIVGGVIVDDGSTFENHGTLTGVQTTADISTILNPIKPGTSSTLPLTDRDTYSSNTAPPEPSGGVISLTNNAKYYVSGNWSVPNGTTINGNAIIYITGNLTTNGNVNCTGNVIIIVEGTIKSSSSDTFANVVFIVGGSINEHYGMTGSMLCFGSFDVFGSMTYNNAVLDTFATDTAVYRNIRIGTYQIVSIAWQ